jgi:hypothetical protein
VGADATRAGRPSYRQLEGLVASQAALIEELRGEIVELRATVGELQAKLDANSRNSSRPPSSDGLSKEPADPKGSRKY